MKTKPKPIRLTKNLQLLLDRYGTKIRKTDSVVIHQVTREQSTLPPIEFAVYETGLKAIAALWATTDDDAGPQFTSWNRGIAAKDGFLDEMNVVLAQATADKSEQYRGDYYECVRLIRNAGLYYALFD